MNKKQINDLILKYKEILNNDISGLQSVPKICSKEEMLIMLKSLVDNKENFSNQEISRKVGFVSGVRNFNSPSVLVNFGSPAHLKKALLNEIDALENYESPCLGEEKLTSEDEHLEMQDYDDYSEKYIPLRLNNQMFILLLKSMFEAYNNKAIKNLEIQYLLGYVEGVMSLFSLINVENGDEIKIETYQIH